MHLPGGMVDSVFGSKLVWSMAIFTAEEPFSVETTFDDPTIIFDSTKVPVGHASPHTRADPFLFVHRDFLYLLHEVVMPHERGKIAAYRTSDLREFEDLGIILEEPHHLSFPFIFEFESQVYLLPEASRSGGVTLYEFNAFPLRPKKVRQLAVGPFRDSFLRRHDSIWYLFTTSEAGLEIYIADDLLKGEFRPHPGNPVTRDPRYARSAGAPICIDGRPCRLAQDCSVTYGGNVHLLSMQELTPTSYRETLIASDIFHLKHVWNKQGSHHLSVAAFRDKIVMATDGKHHDPFFNRFLRPVLRRLPAPRQLV